MEWRYTAGVYAPPPSPAAFQRHQRLGGTVHLSTIQFNIYTGPAYCQPLSPPCMYVPDALSAGSQGL